MPAVSYITYVVARKDPAAKKAQYLNSNKGWANDISDATTYKTELEATHAANVTKADHILTISNVVSELTIVLPPETLNGVDLGITDIGEYLNGKEEEEQPTPPDAPVVA